MKLLQNGIQIIKITLKLYSKMNMQFQVQEEVSLDPYLERGKWKLRMK